MIIDDWVCVDTLSSDTTSAWDRREAEGDRSASCSEDTTVKVWQSFLPGNKEDRPG